LTSHSTIGASSSDRWINCPGSVQLIDKLNLPSESSVYAAEGTAAHFVCAYCVEKNENPEALLNLIVDSKAERFVGGEPDGETKFLVTEEMVEAVEVYVNLARSLIEPGDEHDVEQKFDLSHLHPGMDGTADLVIYKPAKRKLIVVDFKYGKGVAVEVKDNPQLLYYGLGALHRHGNRDVDEVELIVCQPRCPHPDGPVRRWSCDRMDLFDWTGDLVEAAKRTTDPDAPFAAGDWCRWCPAKPHCPKLRDEAFATAQAVFGANGEVKTADPTGFTPDEQGALMHKVAVLEDWCKAFRDHARKCADDGRPPTGWKLVVTRMKREWRDAEKTAESLETYGLDRSDIFTAPEIKSVAAIEKLVGKKSMADLDHLVERSPGGIALVPESDKRPPAKEDAAEVFGKKEAA